MTSEGSIFIYSIRGCIDYGHSFADDQLYVCHSYRWGPDWKLVAVGCDVFSVDHLE